nr:hypothetical protein [uncultured Carboxylicivirga sp.]
MNFGYTLNQEGLPVAYGLEGSYDHYVDGSEPFSGFDINQWQKNLETGEWIYLPNITPIDTTITGVRYDWENNKCYITIRDIYRIGEHEFDCNSTWTDADCQAAINQKFNV